MQDPVGNTRFVLREGEGREFTTRLQSFKDRVADGIRGGPPDEGE